MLPLLVCVSLDLRVSGCYGLFVPGSNPGRVTLATLDTWTTLAVELAHTRALDETRGVAIQVRLSFKSIIVTILKLFADVVYK